MAIDFDPSHESADDVAPHVPVRFVQLSPDQGGEHLQLANDELEGAGVFGGVLKRCGIGLELGDALAHAGEPRLELGLADHPFGVAVDQPADAAAQFGKLALDRFQFGPARPGSHGLQAALVFSRNARRILEQPTNLVPDCRIQPLAQDGLGVAPALAVEAAALRPGAAVVVVSGFRHPRITRLPATAECVAAGLANQQALEQVAHAFHASAVAAPVLGKLLLRAFEQRGFDQRRHRDGDPLLGRGRDLAGQALGNGGPAARRAQRLPPGDGDVLAEAGLADVGGVRQQGSEHAAAPSGVAGRTGHPGFEQSLGDRGQADALLADPAEDATDHPGLVLDHLEARRAAPGRTANVAIAVRRSGQHADDAGLRQMALAAPAALKHARPLVFGEHALELQEQGVLRRLPDRTVEERDLGAGARELLDQHRLVRI